MVLPSASRKVGRWASLKVAHLDVELGGLRVDLKAVALVSPSANESDLSTVPKMAHASD